MSNELIKAGIKYLAGIVAVVAGGQTDCVFHQPALRNCKRYGCERHAQGGNFGFKNQKADD